MRAAVSILLLGCLSAGQVWAEACHVTSSSSSDAIAEVEQELCYEFTGMDDGAIDWSCSNESADMIRRQQQKVASCAPDRLGSCEAALTQATLANYRAKDDDQGKPRPAVPNEARVITHYYRAGDLEQVRIDCESSGGTWRESR